jgi:hypothetical protein
MQVAPATFVIKVTVPPNVRGGGTVQVHGPQGGVFHVQVPHNLQPGGTFDVSLNTSFAQPQQRPYVQQNHRGRSPHHYQQSRNRCCYTFAVCTSLFFALIAFTACFAPAFENQIAFVAIHCNALRTTGVSLCSNEQYAYCEQVRFSVFEDDLLWESVGKRAIENITSASSGDEEGGNRDKGHNHNGHGDHRENYAPSKRSVDFPSVQIAGGKEQGGFNDLLANDVFKKHNFMKPTSRYVEKTTDSAKYDIVLESRQDNPRGFAVVLMLASVAMFAARVCSFFCKTRFEQFIKRPVHFALFGILHCALSVAYFAIIVMTGALPVVRDNGKAIVARYPAHLECYAHLAQQNMVWYVHSLIYNLGAGVFLLSVSCCCLYTDDLPVNGQLHQPPDNSRMAPQAQPVGVVLVNQPHIVTAQVVQPMGEYSIEKGAPNNIQTGSV